MKRGNVIETADGPTAVFTVGKNRKLTLRQKIERRKYKIKRFCVEKTLSCKSHSLDEVMEYLVNRYGFVEVDKNSAEVTQEYRQLRASFIFQYAPELLGDSVLAPQLKGESQEDMEAFIRQNNERIQKAMDIPSTEFEIDFHKFRKTFTDINDSAEIIIEKKYAYIGGGFSGSNRVVKRCQRMYKDIYRYYGVTKEDKRSKSKRYDEVVRTLSL